jgi:hypothetical protein
MYVLYVCLYFVMMTSSTNVDVDDVGFKHCGT